MDKKYTMKEYIEREALKRILIDKYNFFPVFVKNAIENAPTADVAEVVHGYWNVEHGGNGWNDWENLKCSVCGTCFEQANFSNNYCPNCGAKMDGERRTE